MVGNVSHPHVHPSSWQAQPSADDLAVQEARLRANLLEQKAAAEAEEVRRQQEEALRLREQARQEAERWEAARLQADVDHAAAVAERQRLEEAEAERLRATAAEEAERQRQEEAERQRQEEAERQRLAPQWVSPQWVSSQWVSGWGGVAGGDDGASGQAAREAEASSQAEREEQAQQAQRLRATVESENRRHAFLQYGRAEFTAKLRLEQRRAADQQAKVLRVLEEEKEEVRARLEATSREALYTAAVQSAIETCVIEAQDLWERHMGREGKWVE